MTVWRLGLVSSGCSAAIDLIASEHRLPRFLAARVHGLLARKLSSVVSSSAAV